MCAGGVSASSKFCVGFAWGRHLFCVDGMWSGMGDEWGFCVEFFRVRGTVTLVCVMRSSRDVHRVRDVTLGGDGCVIDTFRGTGRFCGGLSRLMPSLVLLSIVLPSRDNCSVIEGLEGHPTARSVPVVVIATGAARVSVVGKLSKNTSSCVGGPFSVVRLVAEMGTLLEEATGRRPGLLGLSSLIVSRRHRIIAIGGRPISLACGRCRLLELLVNDRNVIVAESIVVEDI